MTRLSGSRALLCRARRVVFACWALSGASGCSERAESSYSYYDERIAPIFDVGCQRQTTGCHVDDGHGVALGNLDLRSYDSLMQRRDVLDPVGPYPVGLLLLKGGNPVQIDVRTIDPPDRAQPERRHVTITTDIRHAAGEGAISQGSRNYSLLKQWIDGGHTRTGVPSRDLRVSQGECSHAAVSLPYIDTESPVRAAAAYSDFKLLVAPVLARRCAGSSCHGSTTADMYLTCGTSESEQRWNYELAVRYLEEAAASSELLLRPLALSAGGVFHEGGDVFGDVTDPDYRTLLGWAQRTVTEHPEVLEFGAADDGLRFFGNRVQPLLVRKGCMFSNCHSPAMFHDLRLRVGAQGFFSEVATRKNYEQARALMALDSEDPNQSRLIAKNLCPPVSGGHGIAHRGGTLLEDFGGCRNAETRAHVQQCDAVDADAGDLNQIPAYCVLARWHEIEREQLVTAAQLPAQAAPRAVVFVTRPPGIGGPADFDTFRPGADLMLADATQAASGELELGAPRSLLAGCGLQGSVDVRGPAVSWDGRHIAFAARLADDQALHLYEMASDGSQCGPLTGVRVAAEQQDGVLIHDFDPAYAPDGRLVFASTRGNLSGDAATRGPTRTPAALTPNANLYVYEPERSTQVRQLTFLNNQELGPSFMVDGRVIFTAEKRAEDFHQLAARRQNLDGGDYHPLIAQRPSVGFASATELIELANRNFALVAADLGAADGGGSIMIVNRSIGPDQNDRDPGDRSYIHALNAPLPGAFGGDVGVYRSPAALPSGRLLVACDPTPSDLAAGPHHYGLCELDSLPGSTPRVLYRPTDRIALEPAPVWVRAPRDVFASRIDEPNGSTQVDPGRSDVSLHVTDLPLLSSLLFANTRTGRAIAPNVRGLEVFESEPAPASAHSFSDVSADVIRDSIGEFYQSVRSLGRARLAADGSVRLRLKAGVPLRYALLGAGDAPLMFDAGAAFTGPMRQREDQQFYPGEHGRQSMPRALFNGICGGCHGSISGRELEVVVNPDVLTSASVTLADDEAIDLR